MTKFFLGLILGAAIVFAVSPFPLAEELRAVVLSE